MTLDTRVYVQGPVDTRALFEFGIDLVRAERERRNVFTSDSDHILMTEPGQGLNAWLMVHYGEDGAWYRPQGTHGPYCAAEYCEEGESCGCTFSFAEVSFDTAYSYDGPEGGCGALHTRYVAQLGQWLDAQEVPWSWRNEFTGEVFERYEGLAALSGGGERAQSWFETMVLPAIHAQLRSEGKNL